VLAELVITEREYARDLKLTWQAFSLEAPLLLEQKGIDAATLFGNIGEIIEISDRFLETVQREVREEGSTALHCTALHCTVGEGGGGSWAPDGRPLLPPARRQHEGGLHPVLPQP
jgi:hypothetical protein